MLSITLFTLLLVSLLVAVGVHLPLQNFTLAPREGRAWSDCETLFPLIRTQHFPYSALRLLSAFYFKTKDKWKFFKT